MKKCNDLNISFSFWQYTCFNILTCICITSTWINNYIYNNIRLEYQEYFFSFFTIKTPNGLKCSKSPRRFNRDKLKKSSLCMQVSNLLMYRLNILFYLIVLPRNPKLAVFVKQKFDWAKFQVIHCTMDGSVNVSTIYIVTYNTHTQWTTVLTSAQCTQLHTINIHNGRQC